jgi:hypothetical protein
LIAGMASKSSSDLIASLMAFKSKDDMALRLFKCFEFQFWKAVLFTIRNKNSVILKLLGLTVFLYIVYEFICDRK